MPVCPSLWSQKSESVAASVAPLDSDVTIVSGLPRSGTSMMMLMLHEGGMSVLSDNARLADEDNPRGYFELERVKALPQDASWLEQARGKVVKITANHLEYIPDSLQYRIVFMEREVNEILASQKAMLKRRGIDGDGSDNELRALFNQYLTTTKRWLANRPRTKVLFVNYASVVSEPLDTARALARFLERPMDTQRMALAVDSALYRQRAPHA